MAPTEKTIGLLSEVSGHQQLKAEFDGQNLAVICENEESDDIVGAIKISPKNKAFLKQK